MNEKSHAERVMNKKVRWKVRRDAWLAARRSDTESKIKRLTSK